MTSVLAQLRSINFCRFLTFGQSCMVAVASALRLWFSFGSYLIAYPVIAGTYGGS